MITQQFLSIKGYDIMPEDCGNKTYIRALKNIFLIKYISVVWLFFQKPDYLLVCVQLSMFYSIHIL